MDQLHAHKRRAQLLAFGLLAFAGGSTILIYLLCDELFGVHYIISTIIVLLYGLAQAAILARLFSSYAMQPLDFIWRAVVHVSPNGSNVPAPNLDDSKVAHELVTNIVSQVYQLASNTAELAATHSANTDSTSLLAKQITNNIPLPLFAVDNKQIITFANDSACKYLGLKLDDIVGNNFYSVLDLAFSDEDTLDRWLKDCRANKATDNKFWQRVRLQLADQKTVHQFDMAGYYSKANSSGVEMLITIFDQTDRYMADDHSLDFMALAVHELRTPLTILRGYIEVFEDELSGQLTGEYQTLMQQMHAAALQLTSFVNNILNVARIQEGALSLELREENWSEIIKHAVNDLTLTADVYGKTLEYTVDANVPTVATDKVSIVEVINNLVDNAIKYSGKSNKIVIHTYVGQDGMVETSVQDWGLGIPSSVMPHLFEKFRRNYRNQARIGGTGLGLFLSSQLVQAHGGHIWVKSKEGEGTTVGFTLQPYQQLAESQKTSNNTDITRTAHGWIKNHSLYRK
jgi:signal transduction histidine kinase